MCQSWIPGNRYGKSSSVGQLDSQHVSGDNPAGTANDKTIIEGDVTGDGRADFQIELKGLIGLTAADFLL